MKLKFIGMSRLEQRASWAKYTPLGRCVRRKTEKDFPCGEIVLAWSGYADLDGPAFKAYYCPACAEKIQPGITTEKRP